jgi:hypothetical protein
LVYWTKKNLAHCCWIGKQKVPWPIRADIWTRLNQWNRAVQCLRNWLKGKFGQYWCRRLTSALADGSEPGIFQFYIYFYIATAGPR